MECVGVKVAGHGAAEEEAACRRGKWERRRVARAATASMVMVGVERRGEGKWRIEQDFDVGQVGKYGEDKIGKECSSAASANPLKCGPRRECVRLRQKQDTAICRLQSDECAHSETGWQTERNTLTHCRSQKALAFMRMLGRTSSGDR